MTTEISMQSSRIWYTLYKCYAKVDVLVKFALLIEGNSANENLLKNLYCWVKSSKQISEELFIYHCLLETVVSLF